MKKSLLQLFLRDIRDLLTSLWRLSFLDVVPETTVDILLPEMN